MKLNPLWRGLLLVEFSRVQSLDHSYSCSILVICQTPLNSLLLEYLRMIPIFSLPNYNNGKKVESTMNEVGSKILHVLLISYL